MIETASFPSDRIRAGRKIVGMSAILLPYQEDGSIDWGGFCAHVARTAEAGLTPAVNMDTGYVNLVDEAVREEVLRQTRATLGGRAFVAGAYVGDTPASAWDLDAYRRQIETISSFGATPVIFQSFGLVNQSPSAIVDSYAELGQFCPQFIAFELGEMFAPFGKIYDLATYQGLLKVPQCIGAKHSSLSRQLEWQRLQLRDDMRPDFRIFTGNDLAIDMVIYGSDYLLGLSTFAPDLFAQRDALWAARDPGFYELNDVLQYLGFFAFRAPVPAYKHSAAQFLKLRGWLKSDATHPLSPTRPSSDVEILREVAERLNVLANTFALSEVAR